jgi:acyl carrier protein
VTLLSAVDSGGEGLYWGVWTATNRAQPSRFRPDAANCIDGARGAVSVPCGPRTARPTGTVPEILYGIAPAFGKSTGPSGAFMSSTFDIVAQVISETSEIPREQITPDVHAIDDLGIDSLDFLDIVFALDKKFGIKIPLEAWTEEVNQGRAKVEDYFVLKNLCARIDELVAAKNA